MEDIFVAVIALTLCLAAFLCGKACHATDDYHACEAYCYPAGIDNEASETLGVCICQGVALP